MGWRMGKREEMTVRQVGDPFTGNRVGRTCEGTKEEGMSVMKEARAVV